VRKWPSWEAGFKTGKITSMYTAALASGRNILTLPAIYIVASEEFGALLRLLLQEKKMNRKNYFHVMRQSIALDEEVLRFL